MKNYSTLMRRRCENPLSVRQWLPLLMLLCLVTTSDMFAQRKYTLGTGTDYNDQSSYPAPYGNQYYGAHHQFLVHASELSDLGATAGYLTELGFRVQNRNHSNDLTNFTIKLRQTPLPALNEIISTDDFTTVYFNSSYQLVNGWNTHSFDNGFYWDGTSNILVDVCFNNESDSFNASTYYTATEFNSVALYHENSSDICNTMSTSEVSSNRPNMRFTIAQPMRFVSGNTTQVVNLVSPGTENAPILRIKVMAQGTYNPISATNFTLRTTGTTDVRNISNAKLFYTGTSDVFDPSIQVGSTITPSGQLLSFDGSQELSSGANYFWLTYDITPDATVGNLLDAKVVNLTVDNIIQTVSHAAPAGASKVWPYCPSTAISFNGAYISNVSLGDMDNNSPGDEKNTGAIFTDYTNIPTVSLVQNRTATLSVTKQTQSDEQDAWINVFIDWNRNGSFDDEGEHVFSAAASARDASPSTYKSDITIPSDAMLGVTGMRVVLRTQGDESSPACGKYDEGETEDYMVNIVPAATLTITGNTAFGKVGAPKTTTFQLHNISPVETLTVSDWNLTGAGAASYQIVEKGTTTPLQQSFVLGPNETLPIDIIFGVQGAGAGQRNAMLHFTHDGINAPTSVSLRGYYSSLRAYDNDQNDLTLSSAELNIGSVEATGMTQLSENFTLVADNGPLPIPIKLTGYTVTGPDAALFSVSTLPTGIIDEAIISVVFNGEGATAGIKHAVLNIEHSAANASPLSINLQGRVGYAVLSTPSLVNLPSVSLGQMYTGTYDNVMLIPLTKMGTGNVEFYTRPKLTGSGAGRMEILSNSGRYFIRGKFAANGQVVVAGNGDLNNLSNWRNASASNPVVVNSTQPWLIAVRMIASDDMSIPTGSYNADMLLSNGSGSGVSNASNAVTIALVGEVVNNTSLIALEPSILMFGTVPLGESVSKTLILRNQSGSEGSVELTLTGSDDFTFEDGQRSMTVNLPATQAPLQLQVYYMPNVSGDASASITATGIIDGTIPVTGKGMYSHVDNTQYLIDGTPITGTVNFGNVVVGQTGTKTVTIVNNDMNPITIDMISRSGENATQFSVGDVSPAMEIPGNGGTATFTLSFTPTSVSSPVKNAMLTIFNNSGVPKTFMMTGTAVTTDDQTSSIALSPTTYNFGNVSGSYTFTLTNTGNSSLTVNSAIVIGASGFTLTDTDDSFPRVVGSGETTTFTVAFDAETGTNGQRSGTLLVAVDGISPYPSATLRGMIGTEKNTEKDGGVQAVAGYSSNTTVQIEGTYPNPFVQFTDMRYALNQEINNVVLHIYNALGMEMRMLPLGKQSAGNHNVHISADGLTDGIYYYTVEADTHKANGVMVLTR